MSGRVHRLRVTGGPIVTMDPAAPVCGEVAIEGNRVVWCGRSGSAPREFGRARVLDLKGRMLLPGFTDCHTHFLYFAVSRTRIDLRGTESAKDCALRVIAHRKAHGVQKGWLVGTGADPNVWTDRDPRGSMTREVLDRAAPDVPVALYTHDEHTLWVNSAALWKARITAGTPDPPGGRIVRDAQGEPTGRLLEEADDLVWRYVPRPSGRWARRLIVGAQKEAHRAGVVGLGDVGKPESLDAFAALDQSGKLKLRVTKSIPVRQLDAAIAMGLRAGIGGAKLRIGGVKLFLDGALGSRTAWMKKPYTNERGSTGICRLSREKLVEVTRRAVGHGLPIWAHAIGDAAVGQAIDVFSRHKVRRDCAMPHRIEHLQLLDMADLPLLAQSGVVGSMQPSHLLTDRDTAEAAWGKKRCGGAFALRSLLDAGVPLGFGSDVPIESMRPLEGIVAAVNRCRNGDAREAWFKRQRVSIGEAVHGFTMGAAHAHGRTVDCGSITPGKFADLVVVDRDIFAVPGKQIGQTQIDVTIFDGRIVYSGDGNV